MIARLAMAFLLLLPTTVFAHGEHGGAQPIGAVSLVSIQGYQVELLSQPSPLAPAQAGLGWAGPDQCGSVRES